MEITRDGKLSARKSLKTNKHNDALHEKDACPLLCKSSYKDKSDWIRNMGHEAESQYLYSLTPHLVWGKFDGEWQIRSFLALRFSLTLFSALLKKLRGTNLNIWHNLHLKANFLPSKFLLLSSVLLKVLLGCKN